MFLKSKGFLRNAGHWKKHGFETFSGFEKFEKRDNIALYSFGYQTGRRTGRVLWGELSLSGKGLGQGFLNVAEMMVLVVFLDSIVF